MEKFKLQILRRHDDSVEEEHAVDSILDVEALVDDYFYTDGELNLRNIKYYYRILVLRDGEYVPYKGEV